ncbi:MAG TPA: class I SAM-dependent methyltransferase [Anaerolineales bacterium]|nr:class I SAM-dependent methyltransferase [Anaerolineales bacterium]
MGTDMHRNGDYGLDAPLVVRNLSIAGVACIAAGFMLNFIFVSIQPIVAAALFIWGAAAGASMLVTALLMLWSSKIGKLRLRDHLIDSLRLHGTETVADIGCGRGLLLTAAARRLTTGKAIGIDLWQAADQSGNQAAATLANAETEGVADRVEVRTGDMRDLPFGDQTVDVVVSSLAIHNIPERAGRVKAVQEIARVLKPNGKLALLDFQRTDEYIQTLAELGWQDVRTSGLNFGMFPPVRIVTGMKPKS